jgi:hypothetical protein
MHTYNKFLIVFAVVLLIGGVYTYFSYGLNAQAALGGVSSNSSLESAAASGYNSSTDAKIASDTAFLTSLTSLTRITIDTTLFNNISFKLLKDNNVKLEPVISGRPNPFVPVDSATLTASAVSSVITNDATQIAGTSAIFNGTVNSALGATNAYFEYGTTDKLGKATREATLSLVGTFVIPITGLAPRTTYFYRAAARVNKVVLYGDIVSFTTN